MQGDGDTRHDGGNADPGGDPTEAGRHQEGAADGAKPGRGEAPRRAPKPPTFTLPPVHPSRYADSAVAKWGKIGCIGGLVLAAGALFASFLLLNRGMQMLGERAIVRIQTSLPAELTPAEQARIEGNLERLEVTLHHDADAERILSRFLGLAAPVLEDDVLSVDEVASLSQGIEELLDPSSWVVDAPPAPANGGPTPIREAP